MRLAQSFRYKGIPIVIDIDPISEMGHISFKDKHKAFKSMDINRLELIARSLIDQEENGVLYYSMY